MTSPDPSPLIIPVLLCGGAGTRLWPLSRKSHPKQFAKLAAGEDTLFQSSAERLTGKLFAPPVIVTHVDFRFIVEEQLAEKKISSGAILLEPEARNTAPAVLAAALHVERSDPDTMLLVAPSDHLISDTHAFRQAILAGLPAAHEGNLVTFGIKPTRAETGYGYLQLNQVPETGNLSPIPVQQFVEKPDANRAADMLAAETFMWNAGIFLFGVRQIIEAYEGVAPDMLRHVRASMNAATREQAFIHLESTNWAHVDSNSIDYVVMEKAANLCAVPFAAGWSDLGGWGAVWREAAPDASGTVTSGSATALDCTNTLLRSETAGQEIVGLGLDNIIAIAMPDAVLVMDASRAQDVKKAVSKLTEKGAGQAKQYAKQHHAWGVSESLASGDHFQIKQITLKPGQSVPLTSTQDQTDHVIVVAGNIQLAMDDDIKSFGKNEAINIPAGTESRLENPGKETASLIRIVTGNVPKSE